MSNKDIKIEKISELTGKELVNLVKSKKKIKDKVKSKK